MLTARSHESAKLKADTPSGRAPSKLEPAAIRRTRSGISSPAPGPAGEATAEESGGESEYADEPGLEGELPHPEDADTPDLMGPPVGEELQAKAKGKRIVVDLDKQTATAMEDGKPVRTMPISSGRAGHRTPKGHFTIYETGEDHTSSTYGKCVSKGGGSRDVDKGAGSCKKGETYKGAPMPFFQRFNGAVGLHQSKLPGHPDSHGCVRLSEGNAK